MCQPQLLLLLLLLLLLQLERRHPLGHGSVRAHVDMHVGEKQLKLLGVGLDQGRVRPRHVHGQLPSSCRSRRRHLHAAQAGAVALLLQQHVDGQAGMEQLLLQGQQLHLRLPRQPQRVGLHAARHAAAQAARLWLLGRLVGSSMHLLARQAPLVLVLALRGAPAGRRANGAAAHVGHRLQLLQQLQVHAGVALGVQP